MNDCRFTQRVFEYIFIEVVQFPRSLVATLQVPHETVNVSTHCLCTPGNHAPVYCHFIRSHIHRVHACLAVTCCLHFGQTDPFMTLFGQVTIKLFMSYFIPVKIYDPLYVINHLGDDYPPDVIIQ